MHAVIVGAGRLGRSLARWLISSGHEVVVVDERPERCADIESELGGIAIVGDGTTREVLSRSGAARASTLVATTNSTASNLVACQIAIHEFEVDSVVGRVDSEEHATLFEALGIKSVNLVDATARRVQECLPLEGVTRLMDITGATDTVMVTVRVYPSSPSVGSRLRDVEVPEGTMVPLVISRSGNMEIPTEETMLRSEDQVVAITKTYSLEQLRDLLGWRTGA